MFEVESFIEYVADFDCLEFFVNRKNIVEDTLYNFDALPQDSLCATLKISVEFINEAGIDAGMTSLISSNTHNCKKGGLTNEWVSLVMKNLLDPRTGLFEVSANRISLQPSPVSAVVPNNLKYYRLVGRMIAYVNYISSITSTTDFILQAIIHEVPMQANFTKPMIKQLLGNIRRNLL